MLASLAPASVSAQVPPGQAQCQDLILRQTLPLLQYASRFSPGGVFPYGFGPLAQPFATSPAEGAVWGYPQTAYYASYAYPAYAQMRPGLYPAGYPQASVYPLAYPPEMPPPVPSVEPNPQLSSAAILQVLQSDGTWDQLTSAERANFLLQLAALQQSEIGQRIAQAGLQQNAQASVMNARRMPYDLSVAFQSNARDWFQSYVLYASTVQNLLAQTCNTTTGALGTGLGTLAGVPLTLPALQAFCAATTLNLAICSGLR
jgi:hypothetical protein